MCLLLITNIFCSKYNVYFAVDRFISGRAVVCEVVEDSVAAENVMY